MNTKTILTTTLIFVLALGFTTAAQPLPHAFEGKIIAEDGTSTNMKTLTAQIDGVTTATTKINGNSYSITVIDNTLTGGLIEFFIGGEKSGETFDFSKFEVTKTNLTFDTVPLETIGSCGDAICDSNVNECSFCAIDCPVSSCLNNNVCDTAIGEDEVTAPSDCVAAEVTPPANSGSSGGSSGGSGSSSSSGSTAEITTTETIPEETVSLGISIETLNEEEKIKEELVEERNNPGFFGITGRSVLVDGDGKPRSSVTIIALLLIGALFFFARKKLNKTKESK